jgi:hypothetical protein
MLVIVASLLLIDLFFPPISANYLVYARNAARGQPFTFNPGQFSSGATSAVWPLLLAAAYFVPNSILAAKLVALAVTLGAMWMTFLACFEASASRLASALALVPLLWLLIQPSTMLYESPFLVLLMGLSIVLMLRVLRRDDADSGRERLAVSVVWALLPLARPDATIVVAAELGALLAAAILLRGNCAWLLLAVGAAAIPAGCYYGFSVFTVGSPSTSSAAASVELSQAARHFHGLAYSLDAIAVFNSYPFAVTAPFALLGAQALLNRKPERYLALAALAAAAAYLLALTFILPVSGTAEIGRYVLPVAVLWLVFQSAGLARLIGWSSQYRTNVLPAGLACLLALPLFAHTRTTVSQLRTLGSSFETASEKNIVDYVNAVAPIGSTLFTQQVQDRYFLRDDLQLLSMNGVVDGRITPYLKSGDLAGFLQAYTPRYWLADNRVDNRSYLVGSLLQEAVSAAPDPGERVTLGRITFTNRMSWGAAGHALDALYWKLYELSYAAPSG